MPTLGLKDKNNQELSADDTVQIVNGAKAGKTLYKIRAAGRPFWIQGNLSAKAEDLQTFEIVSKKVMRLTEP